MTKNIIIFPLLATTCIQGMETDSLLEITKKSFTITYHGTKINVTKESLFDISDKATMTVVGKHQQHMLHYYFLENYEKIGTVYFPNSTIYQKLKEYDSDSDDDTYKPYDPCCLSDTEKHKLTNRKVPENGLITKIIEPCILQSFFPNEQKKIYQYNVTRKHKNSIIYPSYNVLTFMDEAAIQEASKDLVECYNDALTSPIKCGALYNYTDNKTKATVALPPLGADAGFPRDKAAPIAITTILEWIEKNPNTYETIYFYVKKRSDFTRYKLLLLQHSGLLHKVCLFYCAYIDKNNILVSLPKDIIDYIMKLI